MLSARQLSMALVIGGLFAFCAGCTPSNAPTAETPAPDVEMMGPRAPENPAPADAPADPVAIDGATSSAPSATDNGTEKLPEVLAVNTAQFGGLLDKTMGKVTVVNFWATWCGPCIHEMPDLVKFYNETERDKVAFLSLSLDDVAEIDGAIPEFQRTHKVPFPIFVINERNSEGMNKAIRAEFRGGIPVTFIYDKSGKMVKMVEGAVTQARLNEIVTPLLSSSP